MIDDYLAKESVESLEKQMAMLAKSKFTPPYLSEIDRKQVDSIIFDIWQELQKRKSVVETEE